MGQPSSTDQQASAGRPHVSGGRWSRNDLLALLGVVLLATVLRVVFYPGMLLSDDVTYTDGASRLLHGDWSLSTYVGSVRYGVDLPVAFFMSIFGENEIAAGLWGFLCSLIEVGAVFAVAHILWNRRTAVVAAGVLAFLPLHVSIAGRLLADPPLAAFITLSVVAFIFAEHRRSRLLYFVAGLASGFSFWIKPSVMVLYSLFFPVYALTNRIWRWQWIWLALGIFVGAGSSCVFFWAISGDPLYLLWVMMRGVENFLTWDDVDTSATFYLWRLFVDVRHTSILGYLALAGAVVYLVRRLRGRREREADPVVLWALVLVALFSLAPVSLMPLKLIMKQSNYMLIFVAPLCLLAAYGLVNARRSVALLLGAIYVAGSLLLAALVQQDTRVFTANSWAAVQFARDHAPVPVFGMRGAFRASDAAFIFAGRQGEQRMVRDIGDLAHGLPPELQTGPPTAVAAYAIIDLHTANWGPEPVRSLAEVPACWSRISPLERPPIVGAGAVLVQVLQSAVQRSPVTLPAVIAAKLDELASPRPAIVFGIPAGCGFELDTRQDG